MKAIQKKRKEIFFTNLLLLGFDCNGMEKENGIPFNKDMFTLPNKKGFEVVTNFLFHQLNKICNNEYKIIWPLLDKKMEQEFRKTCFAHLTKISKESVNGVQFPRMYPTMLVSPGGDRFYELYLAFSTYVMQKHIEDEKTCQRLCFPVAKSNKLQSVKETTLKLSTVLSTYEFLEAQQTSINHQQKFEEVSEDFLSYYRHTKEKISQLTLQKKEELDILHTNCSEDGDGTQLKDFEKLENATSRKDKNLQNIFSTWKTVEDHLSKEIALWDIVRTELDSECSEKAFLDGYQYVINVPEMITTNYRKDLQEKKVQCLVENGKFSIKSFLNLWAVTVKCYADAFEKGDLPNTETLIPLLKENIQRLMLYLSKVQSLSQKLIDVLCEVVNHVEILEHSSHSPEAIDQPVEFPPFTPSLTFTPKSNGNSSVLPENFLFLTPSTRRKSRSNRRESRQCPAISPLHFNILNIPISPGENYGHLKPSSDIYSSKKKIKVKQPVFQMENGKTDEHRLHGFSSELHRLNNSGYQPGSAYSYQIPLNCDVDNKQEQLDCSPLKVLSPYGTDRTELSREESSRRRTSESSDYLDSLAVQNEDRLFRTPSPTQYRFDMNSVEKLANLSKHLHSEDDRTYRNEEHYRFPHLSFSGEEMLDDMTLPHIPFF